MTTQSINKSVFLVLSFFVTMIMACPARAVDDAITAIKNVNYDQEGESFNDVRRLVNKSIDDPALRAELAPKLAALLKADATFRCKQFACQQLARIGSEREVQILTDYLLDQKLHNMVRYALESIPSETLDEVLISAMNQAKGQMLKGLINSLANRQAVAATDNLGVLLRSNDVDIAKASAWALGRIATEEAVAYLKKALSKVSDDNLRNVIADSYLLCAEKLAEKNPDKAESIDQEVFKSNLPGQIRSAALVALADLSRQSTMTYLVEAFEQDDPIILRTAARISGEIQDEKVTDYLVNLLPQVSDSAKVAILTVLGNKANKHFFGAIREQYQSDNESVRIAALKAMAETGDLTIVKFFAECASQVDKAEADTARRCLYSLQLDGADEQILQGSQNKNLSAGTRVELVDAASIRKIDAIIPLLFDCTQDEDSGIRKASWKALKRVAGVEHSDKIVKLMLNAKSSDLPLACSTILTLGKNPEEKALVSKSIISTLPVVTDLSTLSMMLELLGRLGAEEGLDVLTEALEAKEMKIQHASIRGLLKWPDARPVKALRLISETSDDNTSRLLALRGYLQLIVSDDTIANKTKTQLVKQAFEKSKNLREKKYVLSVLAKVEDYSSFQLALQYMNTKELESEAQSAVINIAKALVYSYPSEIKAKLEKIANKTANQSMAEKAREIIEKINSNQDYLTSWQISGPYTQGDKDFDWLFSNQFAPEQRGPDELPWKRIASGTNPQWDFMVDIGKVIPGNNCVAYVRNKVYADHPQKVKVWIGSDDGFKFWINKTLYGQNHAARGYTPDEDVFRAELQQGWNLIMLKITQLNAGWEFSVKMTHPDGSLIEGMKSSLDIIEDDLPTKFADSIGQQGCLGDVEGQLAFEKKRLSDMTYEAASVFDVDKDGNKDIVSGEYWFAGPDFTQQHKICTLKQEGDYYDDFCDYPMDVNGDGYLDIITGSWFSTVLRWRENPKGQPVEWNSHTIDECGNIETIRCWDIDGDGTVEIVPNLPFGPLYIYRLVRKDDGTPSGTFDKITLFENNQGYGLGFGDVNGDGRGDFILSKGWLEAPEKTYEQKWVFHQEFDLSMSSVPILVYDVDEDGIADIIEGQAHGYGLNWWKQTIDPTGQRHWTKHPIDTLNSQYHDLQLTDIDNDGTLELITGKRYRAHSGKDPGSNDPVGLYYFKIKKGQFERVILDYGPVDSHSGAGIYFWVEDIDNDGFKDIVAPGKEGLYLFKLMGSRT